MLKSLEKLRSGHFGDRGISSSFHDAYELADEIQAEVDEKYIPRDRCGLAEPVTEMARAGVTHEELLHICEIMIEYGSLDAYIDKYYLPRPLFEDGEPVQFGDEFIGDTGTKWKVQTISVFDTGTVMIGDGGWRIRLESGDRLKHPPEPDTQDKIDDDATLGPYVYCKKFGLICNGDELADTIKRMARHLLARQRKLDRVE